jgi:hypothetical protein
MASDWSNEARPYKCDGPARCAWFGWPDVPEVEAQVTAWFEAKTLNEEKAAVRRLNKAAFESVVYAPTGFFLCSITRGART